MLEVGSAFRILTFRNYTLVNPQVGSPRDLGVRHKVSVLIEFLLAQWKPFSMSILCVISEPW